MWRRFSACKGEVVIKEAGTYFINTYKWQIFGSGPFEGMANHRCCPSAGTLIKVRPWSINVRSADDIPGYVEVVVECQVLEWDVQQILALCQAPFLPRAEANIKHWVADTVAVLNMRQLSNHVDVVHCLNAPDALTRLNAQLGPLFLQARRVAIGVDGIGLLQAYQTMVAEELEQRRKAETRTIEHAIELAAVKHEHDKKEMALHCAAALAEQERTMAVDHARHVHALAELEVAAARKAKASQTDAMAEETRALIAAGLTPAHVANIFVTDIARAGVAEADKVFVGLPLGLGGLRGVAGVLPKGSVADEFEEL